MHTRGREQSERGREKKWISIQIIIYLISQAEGRVMIMIIFGVNDMNKNRTSQQQ
jgi:hypothetical protein